jgi:hypothetical protein
MSDWMERCARPNGALRLAATLLLACVGACASEKPPPAHVVKKAPPAPDRKLAWMPLDSFDTPTVSKAVNDNMSRVKVAGTSAGVKAAVSMEVAQLAIECIEPTPTCYRAVGHSLGADELIWAEIDPAAPDDKIRITVVLFDVQSGTASRRVGTYDGPQAARAGVAELVGHAADGGSRAP